MTSSSKDSAPKHIPDCKLKSVGDWFLRIGLIQYVGKWIILKVMFSLTCTEALLQIYTESEGRYCAETFMEDFCTQLLYVSSTYRGVQNR